MKLSSALCLALALGWARENASYTPFAIPKGRRHAFSWKELQSTSSKSSSSPHPPDKPPSNELLNLYFASTPGQTSVEQQQQQQQQQQQPPGESETISPSLELVPPEPTPSSSQELVTPAETPLPTSISVPAKPWMTQEQKEEINAAANRLVQDVWKPLFESSVQPGVPADTIKGAALVGATLAFLASKGLVVTSAAGLSAAYVAISQGVAGDFLRTMGGIAWDVTESATKLIQMATTNDPTMTGISKELVNKVTAAVKKSQSRANALQDLGDMTTTTATTAVDVQEATEAFLESQDELARVLREAETAIGAADAAIAQAEQTLWQDQLLETTTASTSISTTKGPLMVDLSVPYNAAAQLAYEASDQSIPFEDFEPQYLAEAIALVKSKNQASKKLLEQAKQKIEQEKREQEEEEAKRKAQETEKARWAAEQEAKRIAAEAEKARVAAEQEAKRKAAEEEKARIAAELEAKQKAAEEEKARLAAKQEADRKAAEAEKARLPAKQKATNQKSKVIAKTDIDDDDDDDWLAAVEMAQKGIEGKIVGLDDAIRDENGKASWDAAGALAQELSAFDDDDDDDDDSLDLEALGRAARAAVEKFEAQGGMAIGVQEDDEDDDADDELDDLFDVDSLEKLGLAARKAVEAFEGVEEIGDDNGDDDDVQGIDGVFVASTSGRSSASSTRQPIQRDWSALTVAKLKDELRSRGLKAYGKKTELVAMLEAYDRDQFSSRGDADEDDNFMADDSDSEDELLDLGDLDLEELGRQARAAVELGTLGGFDAEEPTDEVLMQLENEESLLLSDFLGAENKKEKDYSRMTVLELKEELRERGLPLSGKKSELIERLQATDLP